MLLEEYRRAIKQRSRSPCPTDPQTVHCVTVTVVGEPGVGKSSIVRRFREADFRHEYFRTFGVERSQVVVDRPSDPHPGRTVNIRFLDTSEMFLDPSVATTIQDQVDALHASLSNYVMVVYDVTDHASFLEAKDWVRLVKTMLLGASKLVLVGNKTDNSKQREVHRTAGEVFAYLNKMTFMEVSAKEDTNIQALLSTFI